VIRYQEKDHPMPIATTHVGSLPRGDALTPLLLARDKGEPYDAAAFDAAVQSAVTDAVAKQREAGVDIVSDGELGKVGYSTYMIERLSGFGGHHGQPGVHPRVLHRAGEAGDARSAA
jgi:5-methyltetrahydropteroyltriglutamate--homocysteine methyltransferase